MFSSYYMDRVGHVYPNKLNQDDVRVVVISPEDAEQVERLADIFCARPSSGWVEQMQAALREFADPKPPKPAEPTGLGAVVQDARGRTYVRVNRVPGYPWMSTEAETGSPLAWVDLDDAVEVLSEGVGS